MAQYLIPIDTCSHTMSNFSNIGRVLIDQNLNFVPSPVKTSLFWSILWVWNLIVVRNHIACPIAESDAGCTDSHWFARSIPIGFSSETTKPYSWGTVIKICGRRVEGDRQENLQQTWSVHHQPSMCLHSEVTNEARRNCPACHWKIQQILRGSQKRTCESWALWHKTLLKDGLYSL